MLDKRTERILDIINNKCEDGAYKVLESQDIIAALDGPAQVDTDSLSDIIDYLCEREYVRCKYSDKGTYCIAPLPRGRMYYEKKEEQQRSRTSYRRLVVLAFLGSLLGGALGAAVHAFILKMIGG